MLKFAHQEKAAQDSKKKLETVIHSLSWIHLNKYFNMQENQILKSQLEKIAHRFLTGQFKDLVIHVNIIYFPLNCLVVNHFFAGF